MVVWFVEFGYVISDNTFVFASLFARLTRGRESTHPIVNYKCNRVHYLNAIYPVA